MRRINISQKKMIIEIVSIVRYYGYGGHGGLNHNPSPAIACNLYNLFVTINNT